jgi:hypothetical protein
VNVFFREERLPIAEGWKRSPVPIDNDNLGVLTSQISAASDWTPDSDCATVTFVSGTNSSVTTTF